LFYFFQLFNIKNRAKRRKRWREILKRHDARRVARESGRCQEQSGKGKQYCKTFFS
jgi:hypothetical protein